MSLKRKVLVAISDPDVRQFCEDLCLSLGYLVVTAESAEQALLRMSHASAQIVISEWDEQSKLGSGLCQNMRQNRLGTYVYFIAMASKTEDADLQEAIAIQVDELISKPVSPDQLRLSLIQADRALDLQNHLHQLNEAIPDVQRNLEKELFLLRQLQASMQPRDQQRLGGVKIHLYSQPVALLSSTQCAVFNVRDGKVGFVVVDVKRAGIPGAIRAMGFARLFSDNPMESVIFKMRSSGTEPLELRTCDEVLSILNTVYKIGDDDLGSISALYGIFDANAKTIEIASAGMPCPYLIRRNGEVTQRGTTEPALGVRDNYRFSCTRLSVDEGDSLLLYSEGLTKVRNPQNQQLPAADLDQNIRDHAPHGFESLRASLMQMVLSWSCKPQHHVFSDDVTVMGLDLFHDVTQVQLDSTQTLSGMQVDSSALIPPPDFVLNSPTQNNLNGFVKNALVISDTLEPSSSLRAQLGRLGIQCRSMQVHESLDVVVSSLENIDLVLIEGGHPFQLTLRWLELLRNGSLASSPYVIVCYPSTVFNFSADLIAAGAHKLMRFPGSPLELQFHLETASRHIQLQRSVELKAVQLGKLRADLDEEMTIVAQMQMRTLPKFIPEFPQLIVKWIYRAANRVSGDFLGVFRITQSVVGFFVLDGDREGVLGAVKAWALSRLLRGVDPFQNQDVSVADGMSGLKYLNSPAQILKELNNIVSALPVGYRLDCSMVFGTLDCQSGLGVLSNAGNPPVYLSRQDGTFVNLGADSPYIGLSASSRFIDVPFQMQPGESLYLYTDGLTDLLNQNRNGGAVSVSMLQLLEANAFKPANRVKLDLESLIDKVAPHTQPEDVSVLMLEFDEVREVEIRDVSIIELIDRYQPMMRSMEKAQQFPLHARVFETVLSEASSPDLVMKVNEFLIEKSMYASDTCQRCHSILTELVCKIERKPSANMRQVKLSVVLMMHVDQLGLILIDNARPLKPSDNAPVNHILDWVKNAVDEFRLVRPIEQNQILLVMNDKICH